MFLRLALCAAMTAGLIAVGWPQPSSTSAWAQSDTQAPAASPAKPDAKPDTAPSVPAPPTEPFAEDTTLTAKPMVYVKGTGTWDTAFQTITSSFKTLKAYVGKEGLKVDGQPMTIFTSTDDTGFQFEAALPVAEAPKNPPKGEIAIGSTPQGHALKFVHHGSYDGLDNTYEAITNYLDDKKLEAKDMFIEQYLTDPLTTDEDHLVVNVYVLVK